MPVVITDHTNRVWAVEQPVDGFIHVGWTGKSGPRLVDVLEFISSRQKQFDSFVQKKREETSGKKVRGARREQTDVVRTTRTGENLLPSKD